MGEIKDRNCTDLTEAEENKKIGQEYTEGLYKKSLNDLDNHDGMVTHLVPDIQEDEVKWALGHISTNKLEVVTEFQLRYLKDDDVKVLH